MDDGREGWLFDYYIKLIDINKSEEESIWTSTNIFLIVHGILLAALTQLLNELHGIVIGMLLSFVGVTISFMWFFLMRQKRLSLRFYDHQLIHLEEELFKNRLDKNGKIEDIFPIHTHGTMAFYNSYANKNSQSPLSKRIIDHHLESQEKAKKISKWLDDSAMKQRIFTNHFPVLFILIWMASSALLLMATFDVIIHF